MLVDAIVIVNDDISVLWIAQFFVFLCVVVVK